MKNFFTLLFFCCLFSNCSDDDQATMTTPSSTFASRPEANSSFDDSYKGIYKGIVIGKVSGTIYVDLLNDGEIWAKLRTDNHETYVLENIPLEVDITTPILMKKFRFADDNISFDVKMDDNGNNIFVSNLEFFSDETSKICLMKEKSTSLVKCYSGRFISDAESGNINFTTDGQLNVKGFSKKSNSTNITSVSGEINVSLAIDGKLSPNGEDNPKYSYYKLNANLHIGEISGYLEGNKFDGDWTVEGSELGDWNATRIL